MALKHFDPIKNSHEAAELAYEVLRGHGAEPITAAQVSSTAAISLVAAERALLALASESPAQIDVNEEGELVFRFIELRKPKKRRQRRDVLIFFLTLFIGAPLFVFLSGPAFGIFETKTSYDSWFLEVLLYPVIILWLVSVPITATASVIYTLFIYLPVIGLLLIALGLFALEYYDEPIKQIPSLLGYAGVGVLLIYAWGRWALGVWRKGEDGFVTKVADFLDEFLFGVRPTWEQDSRRVVELINWKKGVLTFSDLMLHLGMTRVEANEAVSRILVDFGGNIEVTDDGVLLFYFPRFTLSSNSKPLEITPPRFFGKQADWLQRALWGTFFFAFLGCFVHPDLAVFPTLEDLFRAEDFKSVILQGLGAWPALILLIPLVIRTWLWTRRLAQHKARQPMMAILKRFDTERDGFEVEQVDPSWLVRYGGTIDEEADTTTGHWVVFPQSQLELSAAEEVRARR